MDFAKRQLEKYGWSEGQGLGKNATGITEALKPKVKLNTAGIGHDAAEEFTYRWWEDAFNSAAGNINVLTTKDGVAVERIDSDSPEICAVKKAKIKRDKMKYGSFLKRATLSKGGCVLEADTEVDPVEEAERSVKQLPQTLSDEQLFAACGGLTAHKAARHGHKLSGKLKRVQEQEEALLLSLQQARNGPNNSGWKKKKVDDQPEGFPEENSKKRKKKRREEDDAEETNLLVQTVTNEQCKPETTLPKKKKKKRKIKSDI